MHSDYVDSKMVTDLKMGIYYTPHASLHDKATVSVVLYSIVHNCPILYIMYHTHDPATPYEGITKHQLDLKNGDFLLNFTLHASRSQIPLFYGLHTYTNQTLIPLLPIVATNNPVICQLAIHHSVAELNVDDHVIGSTSFEQSIRRQSYSYGLI